MQIFESGSPSTSPMFTAASGTPRKQSELITTPVVNVNGLTVWQVFANAVPACAGRASGNTIDCLRTANSSEILSAALVADQASFQEFAFVPVIDGERGVIPASPAILISEGKFSKIPFISGTNLDEGENFRTALAKAYRSQALYSHRSRSTPLPI
jgi:carboxylesterase type B